MKKLKNLCLIFNLEKKTFGFYYTGGDGVNAGRAFLRKRGESYEGYSCVKVCEIIKVDTLNDDLKTVLTTLFKEWDVLKSFKVINKNKTILGTIEDIYFEEFTPAEKLMYLIYNEHPEYQRGWFVFKEIFENE